MAQFSRVPDTPLPDSLSCCCGKEECASHQAWMEFKAKLESRLILCAGKVYHLFLQFGEQDANRRRGACVLRYGTRV